MVVVVGHIEHSEGFVFVHVIYQRFFPKGDNGFDDIGSFDEVLSDRRDDLAVEEHVSVDNIEHFDDVEVVRQYRFRDEVFGQQPLDDLLFELAANLFDLGERIVRRPRLRSL